MNVDPSGHVSKLIGSLWSGVKKAGSTIANGISKIATKAVDLIDKIPAPVKQVLTGTVNKNTSSSKANTSVPQNTYNDTQNFRQTLIESKLNISKTSTKNTTSIVQSQAKPVISTRNYPIEVVRDNLETVKASCEGTSAVSNQSYDYKELILDIGLDIVEYKVKEKLNDVINLGVGFTHGFGETLTFGSSRIITDNFYENNDKSYFIGKILGDLASLSVSIPATIGSAGAAVLTSPTGAGTLAFSAAATYTGAMALSATGNLAANVISLSQASDSSGGYYNNGKSTKSDTKKDKILGGNGTQFESKTVWQNGKTERIDVENPSPGERPGQIHYHEANNTKWYLDIDEKQFYNQKTGELAPKKIQKLLKDKDVINAINKALKFLGEDKLK